jgi:hypothetical protein
MDDRADFRDLADAAGGRNLHLELALHRAKEGDQTLSTALAGVARAVTGVAGDGTSLDLDGDGAGLPGLPGLVISGTGRGDVRYLALPEGQERSPFVELLVGKIRGGGELEDAHRQRLASLSEPAELTVLIASACPHCPQAVRAAHRLALAGPGVTVTVVDAQLFPQVAGRFKASSVPLTVLDGGLSWSGVVPAAELARRVLTRGDPEYGAAELMSLLEAGRMEEAAERIRGGEGRHFLAAWEVSVTATRIPLMLLAEELLVADPAALSAIVPGLIEVLAARDTPLRGDTADLLGQTGDRRALEALRPLLDDSNPDVAEIAADALETLQSDE